MSIEHKSFTFESRTCPARCFRGVVSVIETGTGRNRTKTVVRCTHPKCPYNS